MNMKPERDVEKGYPKAEFVAKLRRLADAIEQGKQFEIQIAGERIYVPVRAEFRRLPPPEKPHAAKNTALLSCE